LKYLLIPSKNSNGDFLRGRRKRWKQRSETEVTEDKEEIEVTENKEEIECE